MRRSPTTARAAFAPCWRGFSAIWTPYLENGKPIALLKDNQSVTLEPGGQLELSGAPLHNLHRTCDEVHAHLDQVRAVSAELGIGFYGVGFRPDAPREAIPWMPKGRYAIMRRYMPTKGSLGLDMMTRTCTVQVNLDFDSEADMVRKMRVGMALQPIATALFAISPFVEGRPSGYKSYRSHVWTDTDPDRCGTLPFVFEAGMGFERYADYVLDAPMYFVAREGGYVDVAGESFRAFLDGALPQLPGERPTLKDWEDHLTTVFPEVRLKRYIEMRGADSGPWGKVCALPALWVGLLYDSTALNEAEALIAGWSADDVVQLGRAVSRDALAASIGARTVREVARDTVEIAAGGLKRRAVAGNLDADERAYITYLRQIAESGRTAADDMLEAYEGRWKRSIEPLFEEYAY